MLSEKRKLQIKTWQKNNSDKVREYNRRSGKKHRIKRKLYMTEWRTKNKDKVLTQARNWRKKHREQLRELYKRFHLKNRDKRNLLSKARRCEGLTTETIQMVYEDNIKKYGTLTCYLCLEPILFGSDHLEHKTPLSRGGDSKYYNLAVSCQRCNLSKGNRLVDEYLSTLIGNKSKKEATNG